MQAELEDKEFEVDVPLDFSIDPPAAAQQDTLPTPEPSAAEQSVTIPVGTSESAAQESAGDVQVTVTTDEGVSVPLRTDADYLDKVTSLVQHAQTAPQSQQPVPPGVAAGMLSSREEEEVDLDLAILATPEGNDMGIITAAMPIHQKYSEPIPALNPHPLRDIMDPAAMYVCMGVCIWHLFKDCCTIVYSSSFTHGLLTGSLVRASLG